MKIALVSCVKTKQPGIDYRRAADLYTSPLFKGMKRYAETRADRWFILSALHGLMLPDKLVAPYEKTIGSMNDRQRAAWAAPISRQLEHILQPGDEVIFLAGRAYRDYIGGNFERLGVTTTIPMAGMAIGQQLQFLKESNA
jgi:hypothetical protein